MEFGTTAHLSLKKGNKGLRAFQESCTTKYYWELQEQTLLSGSP